MILNSEKLFLRDVYSYDIISCHYNILKCLGYDVSQLENESKDNRKVLIGKMMRDNPRMTNLLQSTTKSIIDEFLRKNNVKNDELIIRQYDGVIVTRRLDTNIQSKVPLKLRHVFDRLLISSDRNMFISISSDNEFFVKGVPHKYNRIEGILYKLLNINFLNKTSIFKGLDKIKQEVLTSEDPFLYFIPNQSDNEKGTVVFKDYGQIQVNKNSLKILETEDINQKFYFDYYIRPFTESITIEFA